MTAVQTVNEKILESLLVAPINDIIYNVQNSSLKHDVVMTKDGPYIHIDNGGSVLAVCHLDYVKFSQRPKIDYLHGKPKYVRAGQLDDRLGLYIIAHHLQHYTDIPYDILLTDSEEIGKSTAKDFLANKEYNWMFSFDREGTDVVLYKYEGDELKNRLEMFGFDIGCGSFSDISYLGHLNIKGMNIGTAYYKSHTLDSYADLDEMDINVQKFSNFLERFHNTKMYHDASMDAMPKYQYKYLDMWDYDDYIVKGDIEDLDMDLSAICTCGTCGEDFIFEKGMNFCPYCSCLLDDSCEFSYDCDGDIDDSL